MTKAILQKIANLLRRLTASNGPVDNIRADAETILKELQEMDYETVEITCPHCKQSTEVVARALPTSNLSFTVHRDTAAKVSYIDWESVDGDADFDYRCSWCNEILCSTLDELDEKLNKGDLK